MAKILLFCLIVLLAGCATVDHDQSFADWVACDRSIFNCD